MTHLLSTLYQTARLLAVLRKERRKRKDRRKSLSLDALHPFLLEEDKDESKQAPSPVPEASLSPEREAPNEIDEMDVVSLARRFVSSTNPDESEAFASMIYSKHGYEVSQIRTPTSKSLQDSPPRHRQPKKKEIIKVCQRFSSPTLKSNFSHNF